MFEVNVMCVKYFLNQTKGSGADTNYQYVHVAFDLQLCN